MNKKTIYLRLVRIFNQKGKKIINYFLKVFEKEGKKNQKSKFFVLYGKKYLQRKQSFKYKLYTFTTFDKLFK